jgi:hypothetical protein
MIVAISMNFRTISSKLSFSQNGEDQIGSHYHVIKKHVQHSPNIVMHVLSKEALGT